MQIRMTVDLRDFLDASQRMELQGRLPEFTAKTLAVSMRDLAYNNAAKNKGKNFWMELAEGVRVKTDGLTVTIDHKTNDTNHLAEHVHEGGIIRPKNSKYLAIPIDKSVEGEYASDQPEGSMFIVRRKQDGANGRAYLMRPAATKRGKPKLLYVLVRQTKPQRPRPWWPTDDDFNALAERETNWWLTQYLPKTI